MSDLLATFTTMELLAELQRRDVFPRCPCARWKTYWGRYDADGETWRCRGCQRAITKCRCA